METNVNYTAAGTFVLVLMVLIVFSVIWLSAGISTGKFDYYQVNMKESVIGLNPEGMVKFNGVDVGTVTKMKVNKDNPRIVELTLKVKQGTPITAGTKAKLSVQLLTGTAFILLE